VRNAEFAEKLFWSVLGHLQHASPDFAAGRKGKGLLRRFKVRTHAVDSTVIQLVANCMDWAKHRRRKAAAKMHLRLDLHSFLPSFAIVVFDKAYVDFDHLTDLDERGVWWVTRAKDNMKYRAMKNHPTRGENILKDQTIALQGRHKGMKLRRVEARVEVDGAWRVMVFITNNMEWCPGSVCDLYRRRWDIEVFSSSGSSKASSPAVSSGTAPMLRSGRFTRLCWSMCCCDSWRTCRNGDTASPG
jgi:hypothetical protein